MYIRLLQIEDCHKTSVSTGKMDSAGLPREIKSAFVMTMDSAFSSFDINVSADNPLAPSLDGFFLNCSCRTC